MPFLKIELVLSVNLFLVFLYLTIKTQLNEI
jgi:hypothetical protein